MNKLKFLLVSIIAVFLVCIVSFSACKKDDDAASDGIKFANAVCDCYKNYGKIDLTNDENNTLSSLSSCTQYLFKRYSKYFDEYGNITNKSFEDAFIEEIKKCDI